MECIEQLKSGNVIDLIHIPYKTKHTFMIEIKQPYQSDNGNHVIVSFAKQSNPYARLFVNQAGELDFSESSKSSNIKGSLFQIQVITNSIHHQKESFVMKEEQEDEKDGEEDDHINIGSDRMIITTVTISCVNTRSDKEPQSRYFLTVNEDRKLTTSLFQFILSMESSTISNESILFNMKFQSNKLPLYIQNYSHHTNLLKDWQYIRFLLEGYLIVPNLVAESARYDCVRLLNHNLGIPGAVTAGGFQEGLGKLSGSITNSKVIKNLLLYPSTIFSSFSSSSTSQISPIQIVEELFGYSGSCDMSRLNAQIAFRFPEYLDKNDVYLHSRDWHTDGYRQGKEHGFSLLVGINLSDTLENNHGNLLLWPGSHTYLHSMKIGDCGQYDINRLEDYVIRNHLCSPEEITQRKSLEYKLPSLGEPVQIHMKANDMILIHPDLAHTGGPNLSCNIRQMVYFRLRQKISCVCICNNTPSINHMEKTEVEHRSTEYSKTCVYNSLGTTFSHTKSADFKFISTLCCEYCGCTCKNRFKSWEDIVQKHRIDKYVDLSGLKSTIEKLKREVNSNF